MFSLFYVVISRCSDSVLNENLFLNWIALFPFDLLFIEQYILISHVISLTFVLTDALQ